MGGITSLTQQQLHVEEPGGIHVYTIRRKIQDTLQGQIILLAGKPSDPNTQPIVIKKTSKELVNLGLSRRRLKVAENYLEELRILQYLSSLNNVDAGICRIVNGYVWNDDNNYYYAMEYCDGGDLFDYTLRAFQREKHLKLVDRINRIKQHFRQLVRCVYYLHCNGIAHRDLSLENTMLLDKKGAFIKIIDWGVAYDAATYNNTWITNERVGKLNYMAPEVYSKMSYDARAADVWSLGVMLYMMIAGRYPYDRHRDYKYDLNDFIEGRIKRQLRKQRIERLFNDEIVDLLERIFKYEKERITMEEILTHSFVKLNDYLDLNQKDDKEGTVIDTVDTDKKAANLCNKPPHKMMVLSRLTIVNQSNRFLY